MLHDRILVLVKYVTQVISGEAVKDHSTLRSLASLVASLPASESIGFREEFNKEQEDVQLTAFLSTLTKSANVLNDLVDKHVLLTTNSRDAERIHSTARRRMGRHGLMGDWDKHMR
jgi:COP9 signalosome complex subunit 6